MTSNPAENPAPDNLAANLATIQDVASEFRPVLAQAIIARLSHIARGQSPEKAILLALAFPELVNERLLQELALAPADVSARHDETTGDSGYFLFEIAAYLLAYHKEPRVFSLLLDFYVSDDDLAFDLTDFTVFDHLPALLARCYDGGDLAALRSIIANDDLEVTLRSNCIEAYIGIVLDGRAPREDLVAFLGGLLDIPEGASPSAWYGWLAHSAAKLQEPSLRAKIEAIFDRGIDHGIGNFNVAVTDLEGIAETYAQSVEAVAEDILQHSFFADIVNEICGWDWFQPPQTLRAPRVLDRAEQAYFDHLLNVPYVRAEPKLGRNEPCHCGSGRKYKKCCLDDDRDAE